MGGCVSLNKLCTCASSRPNHPLQRSNTANQNNNNSSSNFNSTSNHDNPTIPINNNNSITLLDSAAISPSNSDNHFQTLETLDSLNSILAATGQSPINYYSTITSAANFVPTGKNRKLKKDILKYFKFDRAITEKQLAAKREEFWDTAPAFEGKIEIWTALRAAVEAYEQKNYQLAQAIIDSANIIVPKGFLNDCYDELGNRYQIPIYVLAKPVNMRKTTSEGGENESQLSKGNIDSTDKKDIKDEDDDDDEELDDFNLDYLNIQKSKPSFLKSKLKLSKSKTTNSRSNSSNGSTSVALNSKSGIKGQNMTTIGDPQNSVLRRSSSIEDLFQIKVRVSNLNYNDQDLKLKVSLSQTVRQLKVQVKEATGIETAQQRLFFGGKLMKDRQMLGDHRLRNNVVVQAIVREAKVVGIEAVEVKNEMPLTN